MDTAILIARESMSTVHDIDQGSLRLPVTTAREPLPILLILPDKARRNEGLKAWG